MRKFWFLLAVPVLAAAALLAYQNLPGKRFARHMTKARLFAKENNLIAAQLEYEQAYSVRGTYTPYASLEVLRLTTRKNLQERNPAEAIANAAKFVEANPANAEGRMLLASLAYQTGDLETTFTSLNAVLDAAPGNFPARLMLARIRTAQGRLDLAEEQFRILYLEEPDSVATLLPLADNLLKQGRAAESRAFLRKILSADPKQAPAMLLLVDSYLRDGKPDSAQELLDKWPTDGNPELAVNVAVRKARFHALLGRFPEAKAILAPLALPRTGNPQAMAALASIYAAAGEFDSSLALYQALGEAKPESNAATLRLRILLFLKNQNPARALESAKMAQVAGDSRMTLLILAAYLAIGQEDKAEDLIRAQPDSLQAGLRTTLSRWVPDKAFIGQWALAEYFRAVQEHAWALQASRELYTRWPKNPAAIELYSADLIALRDYAGAAKLMEGPGTADPARSRILLGLYIGAGQNAKAKALAEKCLAADSTQRGFNAALANVAWAQGEKEKGVRYFERELRLSPGDPLVLNNLAWEYGIVQGDMAKARPLLERLQANKNKDPRILDTIGWILAKNGKPAEGERYVRQALNLVPDLPSFLYHMGAIRYASGDAPEAKKLVGKALDSGIPFEERKDAEALHVRL